MWADIDMVTVNCIEQRPCSKVGVKVTVIGLIYLLLGTLAHLPGKGYFAAMQCHSGDQWKISLLRYSADPTRNLST